MIALVVGVGIALTALLVILNNREQKRRTLAIIAGKSPDDLGKGDKSGAEKRRSSLTKKLEQNNSTKPKKRVIRKMMNEAGFSDKPVKLFWIGSVALAIIFVLITKLIGQPVPIVGFVGVIAGLGLPRLILKKIAAHRQKKFLEEFPDALESMVRLLKAGMPVGEAISMVSREFVGPVGEEMSKVYDEQKIGVSMAEACLHAAQRMPITEMQMFATGIAIQQQTGSSLSEILTNLAKVIRARFRLKRKVQALSSEAKASAMIIGSLPVIVAIGLTLINPDYMDPLFNTLRGKFWLGGAIGMMCAGSLIMRQMINFRI